MGTHTHERTAIDWHCHYGYYETITDQFIYHVTQQRRRGELMWFAFYMPTDQMEPPQEVPGPLPLNRREAMSNCEQHAKEYCND